MVLIIIIIIIIIIICRSFLFHQTRSRLFFLTQFVLVWDLLLDPEKDGGVPLIQPGDGIVRLDLFGVSVHVSVFQMCYQCLQNAKRSGSKEEKY